MFFSDEESYLKLGGQALMLGALPSMVEIGLSDLQKPGWAIDHPAHPSPTSLLLYNRAMATRCKWDLHTNKTSTANCHSPQHTLGHGKNVGIFF